MAKGQAIAGARTQQAQSNLLGAEQMMKAGQDRAASLGQIGTGISNAFGTLGQYRLTEAGNKIDADANALKRAQLRAAGIEA